jgi:hypothetical protein
MRFVLILLLCSRLLSAQQDSAIAIPFIGVHFGGQLPGGDLVKRFGPNLNAGGQFCFKTSRNWVFGIESNYFFGSEVKEDVMAQLKTRDGYVIDNSGQPADLRITERGFGIHLFIGKVLPVLNPNPNSGLLLSAGAGYMQHKINLYDAQQKIAALQGNLVYGYDRLSLGYSFTQFVGFLYLSENRLANFYIGIEFYEGLTRSARELNYDTGLPDTRLRTDILTGLRAGWILPLYKKRPNEFYFY